MRLAFCSPTPGIGGALPGAELLPWAAATDRRRENEAALVGKPLSLPG